MRPVEGQIDDLLGEINARTAEGRAGAGHHAHQEDGGGSDRLSGERGHQGALHALTTSTPSSGMEIIRDLRLGEFDVLVGINLLREGLDIPEVSPGGDTGRG